MEINSVREKFNSGIKDASATFEQKCQLFKEFMKNICQMDYDYDKMLTEDFFNDEFKLISVISRLDTEIFKKYKPDIYKTLYNPTTRLPYKNKCIV
jgi:hypothetical protein